MAKRRAFLALHFLCCNLWHCFLQVGYLSFLKIGPKLLRFLPGDKARDLRNWLQIYGALVFTFKQWRRPSAQYNPCLLLHSLRCARHQPLCSKQASLTSHA